jgi:ribosomal protein S11
VNYKLTVLCLFVLVSFSWPQTTHPQSTKAKTSAEQELVSLTRARATALAAGDCQSWAKYVSSDFRFLEGGGSGNRESVVKECEDGRNAPAGYKQERILSDFHVQWIGDTPVVDCLYETVEHFGDVTLTETARQVSTFQRRGEFWVTLLAVNAAVAHDPPAFKIDVATLDGLTGQYAWAGAPGMIDTITRKDDKIYLQATRETSATELISIGSDTFFIHGSAADRMTFFRDASGKVTGEEVRGPDGQGYRAARMNSSPNPSIGIFSVPSIAQKSQESAISNLEITISVHDYADVPPLRLAAAEANARRIFGLAGLKIAWLSCSRKLEESEPADCSTVDATHLVLKILSGKTTAHVRYRTDVLGNAL